MNKDMFVDVLNEATTLAILSVFDDATSVKSFRVKESESARAAIVVLSAGFRFTENPTSDIIADFFNLRMAEPVKLYVGGLAWATTDESLRDRFKEFGDVVSAVVITDRESGRSRGFGCEILSDYLVVEYADLKDAESARDGLNERGFII